MRKASFVAALIALGVAAAPAGAQTVDQDPSASQTLSGRIVAAGRCPVPLGGADDACPDRPLATTVVIQTPDGQTVSSVTTGDDGTFSISLPAGTYQVEPLLADGSPPASDPIVVDVPVDPATGVTIRVRGGSASRE
jgi:hypothetical protein